MSLQVWFDDSFIDTSKVVKIDLFTTNATDGATYGHPNKTSAEVGSTVEYSSFQKVLRNFGFTKNATSITLNEVPVAGLQGIIPGVRALTFSSYDATAVEGITNPTISDTHFWVGADDVHNYKYIPKTGATGIPIFFVDNITSFGPDASWFQIATCNASSVAGTFSATGGTAEMYTLSASASLSASGTSGDWVLSVTGSGTGDDIFRAADYIIINYGASSAEVKRIHSVGATSLTLTSGLNSNHASGENIYAYAREFVGRETTPENATSGQAQSFWNVSLEIRADRIQRP